VLGLRPAEAKNNGRHEAEWKSRERPWVRVGIDAHEANAYDRIEGWGQVTDSESVTRGWVHLGMAVLRSGDVVTTHPGDATLLVFAPDGTLRRQ